MPLTNKHERCREGLTISESDACRMQVFDFACAASGVAEKDPFICPRLLTMAIFGQKHMCMFNIARGSALWRLIAQ